MRITDMFIVIPAIVIGAVVGNWAGATRRMAPRHHARRSSPGWDRAAGPRRVPVAARARVRRGGPRRRRLGCAHHLQAHPAERDRRHHRLATLLIARRRSCSRRRSRSSASAIRSAGRLARSAHQREPVGVHRPVPWLFWWPAPVHRHPRAVVNFFGDGLRDAFDPRQPARSPSQGSREGRTPTEQPADVGGGAVTAEVTLPRDMTRLRRRSSAGKCSPPEGRRAPRCVTPCTRVDDTESNRPADRQGAGIRGRLCQAAADDAWQRRPDRCREHPPRCAAGRTPTPCGPPWTCSGGTRSAGRRCRGPRGSGARASEVRATTSCRYRRRFATGCPRCGIVLHQRHAGIRHDRRRSPEQLPRSAARS